MGGGHMGRATWLADVLRAEGLHVIELSGWRTRETRAGFDPSGLVLHHTATPKSASDDSVRRILRDGRSDLSGPLSQLGLERDGTFVCIAAGRCNHNGYGLWGNDSIGIEAYNDGVGEPWAPPQVDAYQRGAAAICRNMGWDPLQRVKGHRETDPGRKIDPANLDLGAFRRKVAALLTSPQQEDDDMSAKAEAQINRLAAIFGVDDTDKPMPDGLSKNLAARLDKLYAKLGAGRDGLSGNALARLDAVYALVSDPDDLAAKIAAAIPAGSASKADIKAALQEVFADAADG